MAWEIVRVPDKPPGCFQGTTVGVVASNVEPKLANTLVRKLCLAAPLENLRHVKRVRRRTLEAGRNELSIILCPTFAGENELEGIPDDVQKVINDYQLNPFIAKVPKYSASSKEEWEDQCKLWPTSYHPMANVEGFAEFTPDDSHWIISCMKTALNLATLSQLGKQVKNAAVIVDPSSRHIIASVVDQTSELSGTNKVTEAASYAKDPETISFSEAGENELKCYQALFHPYTSDEASRSYFEVSCLYPWRWLEQKSHTEITTVDNGNKYSWHPLRHAAIVAIENAAARDRQLFPNPSNSSCSGLQDSAINSPAKRQKNVESLVQEEIKSCLLEVMRPYLCTGFDIYLVWEPCAMCAMALVHQRIRRIFYAFPNLNAGALGSIHKLQGEKSLNHHYSVYRVFPSTEVVP
ncbi:hypothetical protein Taro_041747 [Colocasia esculenta]|uniref:CMP/dCMP-type deaminase domain-containing protein n=1 Tax=Colocasia esculenta TaxID=4460 RepID=A0A843WGN8_COLES|nr:hypothetical protein [Colocasia esculenta]